MTKQKANAELAQVLFADKPDHWGLRGDPYLWEDLYKSLIGLEAPNNEQELYSLLESHFERLVGVPIKHVGNIYIEKYAFGGMSSGHVCLEYWREKAFPILVQRFKRWTKEVE